ncbi:hypothetical protein AXF42_Ash018933 [Apostasia shenzhenica]|uniref:Transcription factor HBP-1b(C38) n=1 Tax=Apostasia shenzhenica TaxID=1088818 RepID=A0A2I0B4J2_9ASPA|nr:hypothetical protein AXF42_Ash018933 [Apostasia shenzhenica]
MENARPAGQDFAASGFQLGDSVLDLTRSPILSPRSSTSNQYASLAHVAAAVVGAGGLCFQRTQLENWGDSGMVVGCPRADGLDPFDRIRELANERYSVAACKENGCVARASVDSSALSTEKTGDNKILRRLAQNREAARKSRLRKKVYVQHLETSSLRLMQLEQELQRARQQGALAFDLEYARWLDEHQNQINDLRSAINSHVGDDELRLLVDVLMDHYDTLFKLKSMGARSDVLHMLSGLWTNPAERCFMWLGGFRSSELLKVCHNIFFHLGHVRLSGLTST